jgi:hypothetical protein
MAATAAVAAKRARSARRPGAVARDSVPPEIRAAMDRVKKTGFIQIDADDEGDEDTPEPAREDVFAIGETGHSMLADPPVTIATQALDLAYRMGGGQTGIGYATVFIMREMLGDESYEALLNSKRITAAQYKAITEAVTMRAYSALEDEDGNPNR